MNTFRTPKFKKRMWRIINCDDNGVQILMLTQCINHTSPPVQRLVFCIIFPACLAKIGLVCGVCWSHYWDDGRWPLSLLFNIGIITGGTKRRNIKIFGASREALELWVAKADVVTGWSFDAQKLEKITSRASTICPSIIIASSTQSSSTCYCTSSLPNSNIDSFFSITAKVTWENDMFT